jgi:hypothetical protein
MMEWRGSVGTAGVHRWTKGWAAMRSSDFWRLMDDEFGERYSRTLARDLVVDQLGDRTAAEALDAGLDPKAVWEAVCRAQDVPRERWLGQDVKPR